MKVQVMTETKLKKRKMELSKSSVKSLSLDEIENKMIELACCDTDDVLTLMLNEKKMSMLEKVANMKMHRLQLKELEKTNETVDVKPIEVKFISAKTQEQELRIERIDNEILSKRTGNNNA